MDPFGEFPNVGSQSGIFTAADLQGMEFPPINWVVPDSRWAALTVAEGRSEPVFRRYKPFPGRAVASQRAKSGVRHG